MIPRMKIVIDGKLYLTKYHLFGTRKWNVSLHVFRRPDYGRHFHNHPWDGTAYSFILWGGYKEEFKSDMDEPVEYLYHRWFNKIPPTSFHRITRLFKRPTITIMVTPRAKRKGSWGFLFRDEPYTNQYVLHHAKYNSYFDDNSTIDEGYKESMYG